MIDSIRPILLIEDSNEDFEITRMAVRGAGVSNPILRCTTGRQALDYINRRGQYMHLVQPVFIIVDLNLPGIDGRQILAELRKCAWLSAVPALVLTTSTNPQDVRLCYQIGAAGYLVKPVDLDAFESMIRHVADYWLSVVTLAEQEELGYATRTL